MISTVAANSLHMLWKFSYCIYYLLRKIVVRLARQNVTTKLKYRTIGVFNLHLRVRAVDWTGSDDTGPFVRGTPLQKSNPPVLKTQAFTFSEVAEENGQQTSAVVELKRPFG